MTNEERIQRSNEARRILESTLYQEAWSAVRQQLLDDWAMSESVDVREKIFSEFKALERVQQFFSSILADGTLTRATIDRMRKRSESKQGIL
jgi:hypothetical protein